jgi:patatin-like phospholipase/acyl hydrolase
VEQELLGGGSVGSRFDVIAGTSTGGIIALGLGLGLSATDILKLYLERGGLIFPNSDSGLGKVKQVFSTRYDAAVLERELQHLLAERLFGEAQTRLVIPAFNHDTEPHIFKTDHHPDFKKDCRERAVTVARATSAAPSYLDGLEDAGRWFWDGGLFANNPVMMALVDMMACYEVPRENIQIVSLGCAAVRPKLTKKHLSSGKWGWRSAVEVTSALQSHDALGQAGLLIGRQNLIRIDAELREPIELDDYEKAARDLPAIGERLFSEHAELLKTIVHTTVAPRNRFYSHSNATG